MREQIIPKEKRYVSIKAYERQTGLSYQTIMHMVKSEQVKYIRTESGNYKIDTRPDYNADINLLTNKITELQKQVTALTRLFNIAT